MVKKILISILLSAGTGTVYAVLSYYDRLLKQRTELLKRSIKNTEDAINEAQKLKEELSTALAVNQGYKNAIKEFYGIDLDDLVEEHKPAEIIDIAKRINVQ